MLHPSLEVLITGNQKVPVSYTNSGDSNMYYYKKDKKVETDVFTPTSAWLYVLQCINSNTYGNVSFLYSEASVFCSVVRCFLVQYIPNIHEIPCGAYGKLDDYLDFSCPYWLRLPLGKKLKSISVDSLNWTDLPPFFPSVCIDESPIQFFNFSKNYNWIQNSYLYNFLQQTPLSATFKKLKTFDLSQNNLISVPNGTLPNLEVLNIASNSIRFDNESLCERYPRLTTLSIAQNNLSYMFSDIISGCKYIQHLDLSGNFFNLSEHPINIVNNYMLSTIDLDNNKINILPSSFTMQLDKIVEYKRDHNITGELEVKISKNNLLCMCTHETVEFIRWFKNTAVLISDKDQITCSSLQGMKLVNLVAIDSFTAKCLDPNRKIIVQTIIVTTCVILFLLLTATVYRYRWRIQFTSVKTLINCSIRKTNLPFIMTTILT